MAARSHEQHRTLGRREEPGGLREVEEAGVPGWSDRRGRRRDAGIGEQPGPGGAARYQLSDALAQGAPQAMTGAYQFRTGRSA